MGWVLGIVVDGLLGDVKFGIGARIAAGVQVAIEAGEVAAGNFQTDAMAGFEKVAGLPQLETVFVDSARLDEFRRSE